MKILNLKLFVSVASLIVHFSQSARADFSQPYDPNANSFVISDIVGSSDQQVADDFKLSQQFTPGQNSLYVTWWGGLGFENTPPALQTLNFRVRIYANNASNRPTINPIASFNFSGDVTGTDVIDNMGAVDVYHYSTVINGNNILLAGQTYWLSVVDIDTDTSGVIGEDQDLWYWGATSSSGSYATRNDDAAAWQSAGLRNRAFTIDVVGIPEPCSLILVGGCVPWLLRRKYR